MANNYYTRSLNLIPLTLGRSYDMNSELELVEEGFDKLPLLRPGNGGFALVDGSASNPAIQFQNSPSTGIYSPAPNQLAISCNGVNVVSFTSGGFTGSGAGLTNLNASNLTTGTIPDGRFPAVLPAVSGANLTNLNASNLTTGTIPDGRFPSTLPAVSGANLTNLNASNLASGTVPNARVSGSYTNITGIGNTGTHVTFSTSGNVTVNAPGSGSHTINGNVTFGGTLTGNGSGLTDLNASNLSLGTVPSGRMSGAYTGITAIASVLNQAELGLSANSGVFRLFRTFTNGAPRWSLGTDTSTESGSNAGSDFRLYRYNDDGSFLDSVLRIVRQTGQVEISQPSSGSHTIGGNVAFGGTITGSGSGLTNLNASNLSSGTVPTARLGSGTANSSAFLRGDQQWTNTLVGNLHLGPVANPRYRAEHTDGSRFFAGADANSAFVGGETSSALLSLYSEGLVRLLFNTGGRADFQRGVRTEPASVAFSSTPTFDARESNVFYFGTLSGNVTSMTISNAADGQTIQIRFVQDGTGGRTVALPSGALVSGSINTAPNSVTWLVVTYVASASRWEGTWTKVS